MIKEGAGSLEKFSFWIVQLLVITAILEPWLFLDLYNPDLLVLARYIALDMPSSAIDSLFDNTFYVYLAANFLYWLPPVLLVCLLQNIAVIFLSFALQKNFNPFSVAVLILFTYFTVFLNQFRLGMALAVCIFAFQIPTSQPWKRVLLIISSSFFHIFISIWFVFLNIVVYMHINCRRTITYIGLPLIFFLGALISEWDQLVNLRYIDYLRIEGVPSQSFLLPMVTSVFFWRGLPKYYKLSIAFLIFISMLTMHIPSVSGRVAELTCYTIVILSSTKSYSKNPAKSMGEKVRKDRVLLLLFAFVFFFYRLIRWVWLDNVVIPIELLVY